VNETTRQFDPGAFSINWLFTDTGRQQPIDYKQWRHYEQ
jgi:hypothetical protein